MNEELTLHKATSIEEVEAAYQGGLIDMAEAVEHLRDRRGKTVDRHAQAFDRGDQETLEAMRERLAKIHDIHQRNNLPY